MSELMYPFDGVPAVGTTFQVADEVYWISMPLPISLDHINLYLLEEDDGPASKPRKDAATGRLFLRMN